jgi:hypothetical protein
MSERNSITVDAKALISRLLALKVLLCQKRHDADIAKMIHAQLYAMEPAVKALERRRQQVRLDEMIQCLQNYPTAEQARLTTDHAT